MDPTLLLNRPVVKPRIVAKITKFNNLVEVSTEARKSSTKLRKVFEKGSYQKKTQLSVLNRYKKRLETIQKQNDRSFRKKQRVKVKLPDIKKYVGNFFTPGSADDPLKAIGALAAFKAVQKGSKGDWGGALASGLVAAGLTLGPSLLGFGAGALMSRGGRGGGVGPEVGVTPPKPLKPGSISRLNASQARFIQGSANIGDRARLIRRGTISPTGAFSRGGPEQMAKYGADTSKVGKAFGRFGKAIIPGVGAAVGAIDAGLRTSEGDYTGAKIAGTSATLDALAAASAATGIGLPVAGLLSIASFALDVTNLVRDLSGASEKEALANKSQQNRLKQQTEKQKQAVEGKKEEGGALTFRKTLNGYEKAVNKFEEFVKGFKGGMGETLEQSQARAAKVENLIGDQDIIEEPGHEFTNYTAQYLTGDPNSPAYDESHGTSSNYHDHIAFNDREMAIRAYQYLESKGLDVTEFQGFDPVGGHSNGSYHYSGLAFDVPGYQWGATGPIDQRHYNGSRLVRKYLNDFFQKEKQENPNLSSKNSSSQRKRNPTQPQPPGSRPSTAAQLRAIGQSGAASLLERQQPPAPRRPPSITPPPRTPRPVGSFLPYQQGSQQQVTAFYPVSQPQQQPMPSEDVPMMMTGPSEQQLLNSFYKRVLLNTV